MSENRSTTDRTASALSETRPAQRAARFVGLHGSSRAWFIARLALAAKQMVVVCKDRREAEDLVADISFFHSSSPVLMLPAWDTLPFEAVSPQLSVSAQRLWAMHQLRTGTPCILVVPADGLLQRVLPRSVLADLSFSVGKGRSLSKSDFKKKLISAGYQQVSLVEDVGEMAIRGAVIDFFPLASESPVRALFAGDADQEDAALLTLRSFDPDSQRTTAELDTIEVAPVRERTPVTGGRDSHQRLAPSIDRIKARGRALETPLREIAAAITAFRHGTEFPAIELIDAIALDHLETLFDYLRDDTKMVVCDELGISQAFDSYSDLIAERAARLTAEHRLIPAPETLYLTPEEAFRQIAAQEPTHLDHIEMMGETPDEVARFHTSGNTELTTRLKSQVGSGKAFAPLRLFINSLRNKGYFVAFVVGSPQRAERLQRLLLEENFDAQIFDGTAEEWLKADRRYPLAILRGQLSGGIQLHDEQLAFIAESEIFGERSYRKARAARASLKKLLSSLAQLKDDDYVVHNDYGIGIYRGLKHMEVGDNEGDFLQIDYADSKLYLPVQNINRIQKFSAAEGQVPVLDKLGSTRWVKTRQKVKESVVTLAGDLIKLYAQRSVAKGWRFEPKGAEDERFADGFAYSETSDQLKAIDDTIADMATDKPMDRLICGDVGFGKTEVALRAAFKCVQHSRQVALLVPTTILVEQHRATFEERFRGYPVKIGAVSRFYTTQQNRETLRMLATGELDVIIGTQRLLSRDIEFKDLGLLMVDEEHRFGVKQKERLKNFRKNVDVLTLTATPIPRTLHMSLLGIRDISLIATPPHDRKLVRTYVAQYDDTVVRDAVLRELQRGGQCFYLHNRVESIAGVTARLHELIPEARFVFAHGKMSESELEDIMRRFMKHEADVLVSTTIIESGLDIPNANTMIIERADALGLAQLYQLRGRVGRSSRQAYAYLLIPSARNLGADAQKRLKVLQSLDDLGLGFNLAINDLEIRGAGNLLGKEQSGNVLSVGFDLYTKILKEAIADAKGEEIPIQETIDPEVKLGIEAFIPDHYIPDISERLILYQRFAAIENPPQADDLSAEVEDRFGPLPREVRNLVELMRLRALFRQFGVIKGECGTGRLQLSFSPRARIDGVKAASLVQKNPDRYRFSRNFSLSIAVDFELESPAQLFSLVEITLRNIALE